MRDPYNELIQIIDQARTSGHGSFWIGNETELSLRTAKHFFLVDLNRRARQYAKAYRIPLTTPTRTIATNLLDRTIEIATRNLPYSAETIDRLEAYYEQQGMQEEAHRIRATLGRLAEPPTPSADHVLRYTTESLVEIQLAAEWFPGAIVATVRTSAKPYLVTFRNESGWDSWIPEDHVRADESAFHSDHGAF
jgi:hypothetical protein